MSTEHDIKIFKSILDYCWKAASDGSQPITSQVFLDASRASSHERTRQMMESFATFNVGDMTFIPPPFFLDYYLGKENWEQTIDHEYTEHSADYDSAEEAEDDEENVDFEDEMEDEREGRAELKRTRSEL